MTTTAPATLANALAEALDSDHLPKIEEDGRVVCLGDGCDFASTYGQWSAEFRQHQAAHLAERLTAPGGWLDSLAGDEAVVEAVAHGTLGPAAQMDDYTIDGQDLLRRRARRALTALAAALRSNP